MSADAQHDAQHRNSMPASPPPTTTSPQPQMQARKPINNGAPQPYVYSPSNTTAHVKPPRYIPSKVYLVFDIIAKLIASISLLGILVVLAMLLTEIKKGRTGTEDAINSLTNSLDTFFRSSSPFGVRIVTGSNQGIPISVLSSRINPIYMDSA